MFEQVVISVFSFNLLKKSMLRNYPFQDHLNNSLNSRVILKVNKKNPQQTNKQKNLLGSLTFL